MPGPLPVARRDGEGAEEDGYHTAQRFLRQTNPRLRLLIAAINDTSALGALRAVRQMERERFTPIVGYDLNPAEHALTELRDVNSP